MNTLIRSIEKTANIAFRFLYGRWIPDAALKQIPLILRSDSSMVDEYDMNGNIRKNQTKVQIPLWSMNTYELASTREGGDAVQIPLWSMNTSCKGSIFTLWKEFRFLYGRWIRVVATGLESPELRSDSSMVDEYLTLYGEISDISWVQIPLWSMNTLPSPALIPPSIVQIPLWSMNTRRLLAESAGAFPRFRFLYGRWIP